QCTNMLAAAELGQISVALGIGAVQADLIHAQVGMCAVGEAHGPGGARDLLHDDRVRQVPEAGATPALRYGDAQQPLLAERRPQIAREFVAAVYIGRTRRNPLGGEAPHLRADLLEGLIESEITVTGGHELAFSYCAIV